MYNKVVTVFNRYESQTGIIWYPHVLTGVDLNTDRGAILKKHGAESTDNAQLHVAYHFREDAKMVQDSDGNWLTWLPPKEWAQQDSELLEKSITFSPDSFFWEGKWESGMVNDEDYRDRRCEGFFAHMNVHRDNVFKITSVGGPYILIPHFEILGK